MKQLRKGSKESVLGQDLFELMTYCLKFERVSCNSEDKH